MKFNGAKPGVRYTHTRIGAQGVGLADGTIAMAVIRSPGHPVATQRTMELQRKADALGQPVAGLSNGSFDPAEWTEDCDQ